MDCSKNGGGAPGSGPIPVTIVPCHQAGQVRMMATLLSAYYMPDTVLSFNSLAADELRF